MWSFWCCGGFFFTNNNTTLGWMYDIGTKFEMKEINLFHVLVTIGWTAWWTNIWLRIAMGGAVSSLIVTFCDRRLWSRRFHHINQKFCWGNFYFGIRNRKGGKDEDYMVETVLYKHLWVEKLLGEKKSLFWDNLFNQLGKT